MTRMGRMVFSEHELEPVRSAALDGDSAKNSGDDCGEELEYLGHVVPVDFHNEHEF